MSVGDRVRVRGKLGFVMKISFENKSRKFYQGIFGKILHFFNPKERQIYTVAFLQIDAKCLIEDFDRRDIEIWTKQTEREEKLKTLGI